MYFTKNGYSILIILLSIFFFSITSFAAEPNNEQIVKKIENLEKKINDLKKMSNKRFTVIERKLSEINKQNNLLEAEANKTLREIRKFVFDDKIDIAKTKLKEFFKKYKNTRAIRSAQQMNRELSIFGVATPKEWKVEKWIQGNAQQTLENNGAAILVFWEVWCGYCRRELPKLEKLYTEYKNKNLNIIGITKITGISTPEKVNNFITENKITYPIAKDNGVLSEYFKVRGIPAAAIINNGKILWRGHPSEISKEKLDKYLKIK